jgi:predicted transcriptional regulator of viral defense system
MCECTQSGPKALRTIAKLAPVVSRILWSVLVASVRAKVTSEKFPEAADYPPLTCLLVGSLVRFLGIYKKIPRHLVMMKKFETIQTLVRQRGVLRARDLSSRGIPRSSLARLQARGAIEKLGPGLYADAKFEPTENHSLVEVAVRVTHGVICLLSALRFHGLTTQAPFQVWLAIGIHAWRPKQGSPPMRIVHMGAAALQAGVEKHSIENVEVPIFSAAKTVVDCFKYRNKIGLDVAIEAMKEFRASKQWSHDELWRHATQCRVANVMRPYLETLA